MNLNKKKTLTIIIIAVLLFVIGYVFLGRVSKDKTPPTIEAPKVTMVSETESGFYPSSVKIKAGMKVIWRSEDDTGMQIMSDPHPSHSDYLAMNQKQAIGPDDTYGFKFDKPGTYHYHDELAPTKGGTIIVE